MVPQKIYAPNFKPKADLIPRLFWMLISLLTAFIANELRSVSNSIEQLNEKMAVVLERTTNQDERLMQLEKRLDFAERGRQHGQ